MRFHPLMAKKVIDQLIANDKQFIANSALMGSIFYVVLRMAKDV